MKLKFFTIPAFSLEAAEADLNRFLGAHRVSHLERHFMAEGAATATTTSASGCPERIPNVAGKPSRGTRSRPLSKDGANRQGPGASVGRDPSARWWPAPSVVRP